MKIKYLESHEIPKLFSILLKSGVAVNLTVNPHVITENTLPTFLLATEPDTKAEAFSIYLGDELIGVVTINNISLTKNSAYIGLLAIDREKTKGSGLKVIKWVLRYCFQTLNLNRAYGHTWSDNPNMDRIYEHIGAVHEGTEREHTWKQGQYVDMKIWAVLRREWEARWQ
jgi:RimJ/RimL family protein N-acetyltransferase